MSHDESLDLFPLHDLDADLKISARDIKRLKVKPRPPDSFIFDPDEEKAKLVSVDLNDYRIPMDELNGLLERISNVRKALQRPVDDDQVEEEKDGGDDRGDVKDERDGAAPNVLSDFSQAVRLVRSDPNIAQVSQMINSFEKGKRLSNHQRMYIVEQMVVEKRSTKAVHAETGVSQSLIGVLVKEYEQTPGWFDHIRSKQLVVEKNEKAMNQLIDDEIRRRMPFFSAGELSQKAKANNLPNSSVTAITKKLKRDFKMSYRKVTVKSHLSNIPENRILRQMWARKLVELLESDFELFSVDQSAIVSMYPTKRGWLKRFSPSNVTGK